MTAFAFGRGRAALNCKPYFIQALQLFYSADELSGMLSDLVFLLRAKLPLYWARQSHRAD